MEKNSIAIVRQYKGYGGIEHQIENIIFFLKKNNWNIFLITDEISLWTKKCNELGATIYIIPFKNLLESAIKISKICKNKEIQIIQSHMLRESFICKLVKLFIPKIINIFRIHTYIDCSHISLFKKNIYHFACWITNPLVNLYLPINNFNAEELKKRTHLHGKKIKIIHDIVRLTNNNETSICNLKNKNIAMIANFVDFKGHDVLLKGLKILQDKGYNVTVELIGDVPGLGTNKEDYHRLNIIKKTINLYHLNDYLIFRGYCTDIPNAIKNCGIIVLPSDSEGTPNCLIEGMILHKIIVASNVGGIPEFVIDGKTGFLHPSKNPEAFANTIIKVFETPREQLQNIINCAAILAKQEFGFEHVSQKFLKLYNNLN